MQSCVIETQQVFSLRRIIVRLHDNAQLRIVFNYTFLIIDLRLEILTVVDGIDKQAFELLLQDRLIVAAAARALKEVDDQKRSRLRTPVALHHN